MIQIGRILHILTALCLCLTYRCSSNGSCSDNGCVYEGQQWCEANNHFTCIPFNGCLIAVPSQCDGDCSCDTLCGAGMFLCQNGTCISQALVGNGLNDCGDNSDEGEEPSCIDDSRCDDAGDSWCSGDTRYYCATREDGCLEARTDECPAGCSNGACTSPPVCTNDPDCSYSGEAWCAGDTKHFCKADANGCLEESTQWCDLGCDSGSCLSCEDDSDCDYSGQSWCNGNVKHECAASSSGCLEEQTYTCPYGCSSGSCESAPVCTDDPDCDYDGDSWCSGTVKHYCDTDGNGCLEEHSSSCACSCSGGSCTGQCSSTSSNYCSGDVLHHCVDGCMKTKTCSDSSCFDSGFGPYTDCKANSDGIDKCLCQSCTAYGAYGQVDSCGACPTSNCDTVSVGSCGVLVFCGCSEDSDCPCNMKCGCFNCGTSFNVCGLCVKT